jgi:hypothetical protein
VRGGWFREATIRECIEARARGDKALHKHWSEELFMLESFVRVIDLPPGRERFSLESQLTYRQMHMTLLELDVFQAEQGLSHARKWLEIDNVGAEDVRLAEVQLRKAQKALTKYRSLE